MQAIVEIKNLSYSYLGTSQPILSNINLEISQGEFILITGPTGSGKSTLCRAITGLIPNFHKGDFSGEVRVFGRSTSEQKIAGKVGLVFQNPEDQILTMEVESEIAFGPENLGLRREEIAARVSEALSQLEIEHLRDKSPHDLSSGELQKVAIASILAMKPEVVILDEPTSDLDPESAINLLEILASLNRSGKTIILIEHRLENALRLADRIIVLESGKLAAQGSPREVIRDFDLESMGIRIPWICRIARELGMGKVPLSIEEFVESWGHFNVH